LSSFYDLFPFVFCCILGTRWYPRGSESSCQSSTRRNGCRL